MQGMLRRLLVLLATLVTITVNALANILPFNGLTTAQVSANFGNFFVPAGYVFAIWGVIYLGMLVYTIYQLLPSQADNPHLRSIAPAYIVASVANCAWLVLWHYEQLPITVVVMLILLISLIVVYSILNVGKSSVSSAERWLVHVPFSIYLGWISVATIANISAWLSTTSWNGFGISAPVWAGIMMAVAVLLALLVAATHQDVAFNLVIAWALVGIGVAGLAKHAPIMLNIVAFILAGLTLALLGLVLAVQPGRNKLA